MLQKLLIWLMCCSLLASTAQAQSTTGVTSLHAKAGAAGDIDNRFPQGNFPPPVLSGKVTWTPGHYGASGSTATAGPDNNGVPWDSTGKFFPEMDDMLKDDWIQGYRMAYKWHGIDAGIASVASVSSTSATLSGTTLGQGHPTTGPYWVAFDNSAGNVVAYRQAQVTNSVTLTWSGALPAGTITNVHFYNTALIDAVLTRLATHYARPKQLVLTIEVMSFSGGSRGNDRELVPNYILNDRTTYGNSPDGAGGWWGVAPTYTQHDGTYSAAVWRPSVAKMYAATGAALGAKYNSNPLWEGLMDQEPSAVVQCALPVPRFGSTNANDPTYDSGDVNYVTQMKSYLAAWRAAFPNKSIIEQNTYLNLIGPTQGFEIWMITGGLYIAPSAADTIGLTHLVANGTIVASWGLQAYVGELANNVTGTDYRSVARAMMDVEQPDYIYDVNDMLDALNQRNGASHAFWTHVQITGGPQQSWAAVTAILRNRPLINTAYPTNYPQQ